MRGNFSRVSILNPTHTHTSFATFTITHPNR
nr:MAG TPA: hypothetical protein [Caudoviricetes sp.]